MPDLPSSLALTTIADGSQRLAAPIRNNFTAGQTATNALITALSGGTVGQILQATDSDTIGWVNGVKTTTSTLAGGPPGAPADTDIWIATAVDANGTRWTFQYNAGSASAFKWEFIGGGWLSAAVDASEGTSSAAFVDLTTPGPSVTLARGGDYTVDWSFQTSHATPAQGNAYGELFKNAVDLGQAAVSFVGSTANSIFSAFNSRQITGFAAADVLKMKYAISNASAQNFSLRRLRVHPTRIA